MKLANPALDVWIVTGDGDGLSIGGNHMLHLLRRNLDCQVLLFNNEIYGLTKGQYSPTSRAGTRSPSTPFGSVETPINPCGFALGSGARFIARVYDIAQAKLPDLLQRAHQHKGTSFVEIYSNCIVFNDGAFENFAGKKAAPDALLWLEHGKPMLFAKGTKGLHLNRDSLALEVVAVPDGNVEGLDILVHDETNKTDRPAVCSTCRLAPSRSRSGSSTAIRRPPSKPPSSSRTPKRQPARSVTSTHCCARATHGPSTHRLPMHEVTLRFDPLRVWRLTLQRVIEVVHEFAGRDGADLVAHAPPSSAEPAQARAYREQRRLRIAARLRLHQRAWIIRHTRCASLTDGRSPPAGLRDHGGENEVLPMPDMGE